MISPQSWPTVGAVDPSRLTEARLEAHHAIQIVVSLGISFLVHQEDDSHTNLEWLDAAKALAGRLVPAPRPFRGALRLRDLTLLMLDEQGRRQSEFSLPGRTIDSAYAWLKGEAAKAGLDPAILRSEKHYTIPAHPVASGTPFAVAEPKEFHELENYYAGADLLLNSLARITPSASQVRCWPHHFDLATLIALGQDRTIGVGLSPGDDSYREPYYYVSPSPYPTATLPSLQLGEWHRNGWVGAVLTGSRLRGFSDPPGQGEEAGSFLSEAVAKCRELLRVPQSP